MNKQPRLEFGQIRRRENFPIRGELDQKPVFGLLNCVSEPGRRRKASRGAVRPEPCGLASRNSESRAVIVIDLMAKQRATPKMSRSQLTDYNRRPKLLYNKMLTKTTQSVNRPKSQLLGTPHRNDRFCTSLLLTPQAAPLAAKAPLRQQLAADACGVPLKIAEVASHKPALPSLGS
jgi:hypothetical protein